MCVFLSCICNAVIIGYLEAIYLFIYYTIMAKLGKIFQNLRKKKEIIITSWIIL